MTAIPFALIGVVWGHLLVGLNLSMPSLLGLISLTGVVVNDSILLVMFVKTRRQAGLPVNEAAGQASRDRFRAVLLTSLTTIAGLLPLLMEKSLQAQILIPLATSIVFGLLVSTVLVLLMLPALYGILHDLGLARDPERGSERPRQFKRLPIRSARPKGGPKGDLPQLRLLPMRGGSSVPASGARILVSTGFTEAACTDIRSIGSLSLRLRQLDIDEQGVVRDGKALSGVRWLSWQSICLGQVGFGRIVTWQADIEV